MGTALWKTVDTFAESLQKQAHLRWMVADLFRFGEDPKRCWMARDPYRGEMNALRQVTPQHEQIMRRLESVVASKEAPRHTRYQVLLVRFQNTLLTFPVVAAEGLPLLVIDPLSGERVTPEELYEQVHHLGAVFAAQEEAESDEASNEEVELSDDEYLSDSEDEPEELPESMDTSATNPLQDGHSHSCLRCRREYEPLEVMAQLREPKRGITHCLACAALALRSPETQVIGFGIFICGIATQQRTSALAAKLAAQRAIVDLLVSTGRRFDGRGLQLRMILTGLAPNVTPRLD